MGEMSRYGASSSRKSAAVIELRSLSLSLSLSPASHRFGSIYRFFLRSHRRNMRRWRSRCHFLRRRNAIRLSEARRLRAFAPRNCKSGIAFEQPVNPLYVPRLRIDFDRSIEAPVSRATPAARREGGNLSTGPSAPKESPPGI